MSSVYCNEPIRQISIENHPLYVTKRFDNDEDISTKKANTATFENKIISKRAPQIKTPPSFSYSTQRSGNVYESIIEQLTCKLSMNNTLKNLILSPFRSQTHHQRRSRSLSRTRTESKERRIFGDDSDYKCTIDRQSSWSIDEIELNQFTGFEAMTRNHGHKFEYVVMNKVTWCDKCGRFILRYYQHCYQCAFCSYTCHIGCKNKVIFKCPSLRINTIIINGKKNKMETAITSRPKLSITSYGDDNTEDNASTKTQNKTGDGCKDRKDEFEEKIKMFNENNKQGLMFSLTPTSMQGSIRVHMNLFRPITMLVSTPPPLLLGEETDQWRAYKTSFHMPKDTSKLIYINDNTTTSEVVELLLRKFCIVESPRKFSLYHKTTIHDDVHTMRKLNDHDLPLVLCLYWFYQGGDALECNKFILQETDAGDIKWDIFSTPELENFLSMLNREEKEHEERIRGKNKTMKLHIKRRLKEILNENKNNPKLFKSDSNPNSSLTNIVHSISMESQFDPVNRKYSCATVLNYL